MPKIRKRRLIKFHQYLGRSYEVYQHNTSLASYGLQYADYHYSSIPDDQRLWVLLKDEAFRKYQYERTLNYNNSYRSLKLGIAHHSKKQGQTLQDDLRLVWLTLRAGRLAEEAFDSVFVAFDWFSQDANRVQEALERLQILQDKEYFIAGLLLIWIEHLRQEKLMLPLRDKSIACQILEQLKKRRQTEKVILNWSAFLSPQCMGFWIEKITNTWPSIELHIIYQSGNIDTLIRCYAQQQKCTHIRKALQFVKSKQVVVRYLLLVAQIEAKSLKSKNWKETLIHAQEIVEKTTSTRKRNEMLLELAKTNYRLGDIVRSIQIIHTISDDKSRFSALQEIALSQAESEDFTGALETALLIAKKGLQSSTLQEIAKLQAQKGAIEEAQHTAKSITLEGFRIASLREITCLHATLKAKDGDIEGALRICQQIAKEKHREPILRIVCTKQVSVGDIDGAKETLALITDQATHQATIVDIATEQARLGDIEGALQSVKDISSDFSQFHIFQEIAIFQAKQGDLSSALTTIEKINLDENDLLLPFVQRAQQEALREICRIQIQKNEFIHAKNIAIQMHNDFFQSVSLQKIALAQAHMGQVREALNIVHHIKTEENRYSTLQKIVSIQLQAGDIEGAKQTSETINSVDIRYKTIQEIAKSQMHHGNALGAIDTISEFRSEQQRSHSLSEIAEIQGRKGDSIGFLETMKKAILKKELIGKKEVLSTSLRDIGTMQAQRGHLHIAKKLFSHVESKRLRIDIIHSILERQYKEGKISHVQETVQETRDIINTVTTVKKRDKSYARLAILQADNHDVRGAIETAQKIEEKETQIYLLRDIAMQQLQSGTLEEATEIASHITDVGYKRFVEDYITNKRIQTLAQKGQIQEALESTLQRYDQWRRFTSLISIIRTQRANNDIEGAKKMILKAEEWAREIHNKDNIAKAWAMIAPLHAHNQNMKDAFGTLKNIRNKWDKDKALSQIAIIQAKRKEPSHEDTLNKITNQGIVIETLQDIARFQRQEGDIKKVQETIHRILERIAMLSSPKERDKLLVKTSVLQCKSGFFLEALHSIKKISTLALQVETMYRCFKLHFEDGNIEVAKKSFSTLLHAIQRLKNDSEKAFFFHTSIQLYSMYSTDYPLCSSIVSNEKTSAFFRSFLPFHQLDLQNLSSFRISLLYYPFDPLLAYSSVYNFIYLLYKHHHIERAHAVIKAFPELQLMVLYEENAIK